MGDMKGLSLGNPVLWRHKWGTHRNGNNSTLPCPQGPQIRGEHGRCCSNTLHRFRGPILLVTEIISGPQFPSL